MQNPPKEKPTNEIEDTDSITVNIKEDLFSLFKNLRSYIKELFSLKNETDKVNTAESVKKNLVMKGLNVWILICSIFIASIGLNVNSTAAIIGAMLISPLMGPIIGIGFSIGTNDYSTFQKSIKNYLATIIISIIASFVYFYFSPFKEPSTEILSRTTPTLLDVFIAIFGGMAGIIAGSQKGNISVIPGVAIATALMPPLCVAGYGLANGAYNYFAGALYLFLINSICIALSAGIFVRLSHFPKIKFVNKKTEVKVKFYIGFITLIVLIPSAILFVRVMKVSLFESRSLSFISEEIQKTGNIITWRSIEYNDSIPIIRLKIEGEITEDDIADWNFRLHNYEISNTNLIIYGAGEGKEIPMGIAQEEYVQVTAQLLSKDEELKILREQVLALNNKLREKVKIKREFKNLSKETKALFGSDLIKFGFSERIVNDFEAKTDLDTIVNVFVLWDQEVMDFKLRSNELQLRNWMKTKYNLDTISINSPR